MRGYFKMSEQIIGTTESRIQTLPPHIHAWL